MGRIFRLNTKVLETIVNETVRNAAWEIIYDLGCKREVVEALECVLQERVAFFDTGQHSIYEAGALRVARPSFEVWDELAEKLAELGFLESIGEGVYQIGVPAGSLTADAPPSEALPSLKGIVQILREAYEERRSEFTPSGLVPLKEIVPKDRLGFEEDLEGLPTCLASEHNVWTVFNCRNLRWSYKTVLALWELGGPAHFSFQVDKVKLRLSSFPYLLEGYRINRSKLAELIPVSKNWALTVLGYWGLTREGCHVACKILKEIGLIPEESLQLADVARFYFFMFDYNRVKQVERTLRSLGNGVYSASAVRERLLKLEESDGWPWPRASIRYYDWFLSRLASAMPQMRVEVGLYERTYGLKTPADSG